MDFVDAGTSWTKAVSKLFTNLHELMHGHIDDSFALLDILDDVYRHHVDYLALALSTLLQECDSLTAEVHIIAINAQTRQTTTEEDDRTELLRDKLSYLDRMMDDFDRLLEGEAGKSSRGRHYFPNPLNAEYCKLVFRDLAQREVREKVQALDTFIYYIKNGQILTSEDAADFTDVTEFRYDLAYLSWCMQSYEDDALDVFRSGLIDSESSTPSTDFDYEIPSSSLLNFNRDDDLLASTSSR